MESFNSIISGDVPVLVDFYATWCGPCKAMAPTIDTVAKELSGKIRVLKIDIDKNQSAASLYGIRSVPTLVLFRKSQIIWRNSGLLDKATLIGHINYFLQ